MQAKLFNTCDIIWIFQKHVIMSDIRILPKHLIVCFKKGELAELFYSPYELDSLHKKVFFWGQFYGSLFWEVSIVFLIHDNSAKKNRDEENGSLWCNKLIYNPLKYAKRCKHTLVC